MKKTGLATFSLVICIAAPVIATECPQFYFNGKEPVFTPLVHRDQELCYSSYAIGYHYATKTAFYSAEHLTRDQVQGAKQLDRIDSFHDENRIPEQARAQLSDYRSSGFDKGHLTPNGDQNTRQGQYDSFSLVNIVPQLHSQNAGIWSSLESSVRYLAMKYGEVYVLTGGLYNASTQRIKGNIPVPSALYKAVYIPAQNIAGVYVSNNDSSGSYRVISVGELNVQLGFDVLPAVAVAVKNKAANLPKPLDNRHTSRISSRSLLERFFQ